MTQDEYYTYLENASNKLEHFGVKNQKWGRRQWQNEDGSLTPAGYIHYGYGKRRTHHEMDDKSSHQLSKESSEEISKAKNNQSDNSEPTEHKGLTDKQKKAIAVGATAVVAGVALYGAYRYGLFDDIARGVTQKVYKIDNPLADAGIKTIPKGRETARETMFYANKNAMGLVEGRHHNCTDVMYAAELRARGLDVVAKEANAKDIMMNKRILDGALFDPKTGETVGQRMKQQLMTDDVKEIEKKLLDSLPEGGRGGMVVRLKGENGGPHFINYSKVDGKIVITDNQRGIEKGLDYWFDPERNNAFKTNFFRMDDLEIDKEKILTAVEKNDGKFYNYTKQIADDMDKNVRNWQKHEYVDKVDKYVLSGEYHKDMAEYADKMETYKDAMRQYKIDKKKKVPNLVEPQKPKEPKISYNRDFNVSSKKDVSSMKKVINETFKETDESKYLTKRDDRNKYMKKALKSTSARKDETDVIKSYIKENAKTKEGRQQLTDEARQYVSKQMKNGKSVVDAQIRNTKKTFKNQKDKKIISKYLKEHPDSKLKPKEILENYYGKAPK